MPYALRLFTCPDCAKPVWARRPAGDTVRCVPCRIERSAENARQLHAKQGPMYVRWVWACATAAKRIAQETTPDKARRAG